MTAGRLATGNRFIGGHPSGTHPAAHLWPGAELAPCFLKWIDRRWTSSAEVATPNISPSDSAAWVQFCARRIKELDCRVPEELGQSHTGSRETIFPPNSRVGTIRP